MGHWQIRYKYKRLLNQFHILFLQMSKPIIWSGWGFAWCCETKAVFTQQCISFPQCYLIINCCIISEHSHDIKATSRNVTQYSTGLVLIYVLIDFQKKIHLQIKQKGKTFLELKLSNPHIKKQWYGGRRMFTLQLYLQWYAIMHAQILDSLFLKTGTETRCCICLWQK